VTNTSIGSRPSLGRLQGALDLVGHDWGAGHVARLVNARPETVRSWVIDIAGCFDPAYVWHERAQVWQSPGAGEAAIEQQLAIPRPRAGAQVAVLLYARKLDAGLAPKSFHD